MHFSLTSSYAEFLCKYANWERLRRVFITFDVDWAPDYMIENVLRLLDQYDAGATFFATHDSALLRKLAASERHEVGLHPNLAPGSSQGQGLDRVLQFLSPLYPNAIGCRFHVLGFSYRDLMRLRASGLRYDVSRLLYNTSHLQPAWHRDLGLMLIPYCWEDGICENAGDEVSVESMVLDSPGLKVINFHPMNVYVNGPDARARLEFIAAAGHLLECPESLAQRHRQKGDSGAERALEALLRRVSADGLIAQPLRELHTAFSRAV
jgi:peptidoglycan/xylan/chitin deacetylase (PgdA/CDA1 family)